MGLCGGSTCSLVSVLKNGRCWEKHGADKRWVISWWLEQLSPLFHTVQAVITSLWRWLTIITKLHKKSQATNWLSNFSNTFLVLSEIIFSFSGWYNNSPPLAIFHYCEGEKWKNNGWRTWLEFLDASSYSSYIMLMD